MSKIERICQCGCGQKFMARKADIKRGWGKFASKSCKATEQTRRTGYAGPKGTHFSDYEDSGQFSNEDYFNGYGFGAKD